MQQLIVIVIIVVIILIGLAIAWIYSNGSDINYDNIVKNVGKHRRYDIIPRSNENMQKNAHIWKGILSDKKNTRISQLAKRAGGRNMRSALVDTKFGRVVKNMSLPADQFHCNSCWAISTCQAVSDRLRLNGKISNDDELNYYQFHDHIIEVTPEIDGCDYGAYIQIGMDMMDKIGAPLMSQTLDRDFNDTPIKSDTKIPTFKTVEWKRISPSQIKNELETNGTVVAMINLYDSLYDFVGTGIYRPRAGEQSDPNMLHMISIVGYDDRDNTWIIRNSYGNTSGYKGFIKVPMGDNKLGTELDVFAPVI